MNSLLENKINELDIASNYQCWYLVKQDTSFASLCYQVEFLRQFQQNPAGSNLESYIKSKVSSLKNSNSSAKVSETHRALRVAAFFGLITMKTSSYNDAEITPTFYEIKNLCKGKFEDTDLYIHVIQRQIEKIFISTSIDEQYEDVRSRFRLYPVMLLYKVLIELGISTGAYSITMNEYRYLVATTEKYNDYLKTLFLISLLREDSTVNSILEKYRNKFDNRFIQALKQLPTISVENDSIILSAEHIEEVKQKLSYFETHDNKMSDEEYIEFLGSSKSLFNILDTDYKEQNNKEDKIHRLSGGENLLFYGVPGSGKSHTIDSKFGNKNMTRVVFHPDFMNTDFIGQILPKINDDDTVTYEFKPGPFTKVMKQAYEDPDNMYYLIIEEINRGNAPAIFGEIFQLLDRTETGESKYSVVNYDVSKIIYDEETSPVKIPSNLTLIATMNTSDQNVFTLDTAFQRRWNMKMIFNDINNAEHKNVPISDTTVTWGVFNSVINDLILSSNAQMLSSEDKRLGAYFISPYDLRNKEDIDSRFSEKVIKYLWDDAFKFSRDKLFDITELKSLEDVITKFISEKSNNRFLIFKEDIRNLLVSKSDSNLTNKSTNDVMPESNTEVLADEQ